MNVDSTTQVLPMAADPSSTASDSLLFDVDYATFLSSDTMTKLSSSSSSVTRDTTTTTTSSVSANDPSSSSSLVLTPRVADLMAALGEEMPSDLLQQTTTSTSSTSTTTITQQASSSNTDHMLFDHDLSTTTNGSHTNGGDGMEKADDMPMPLNFTFTPTANAQATTTEAMMYHTSSQNKHKRHKSNPDVIHQFQASYNANSDSSSANYFHPQASSARPNIPVLPTGATNASASTSSQGRTVPPELAKAVFTSIANDFQDPPTPSVPNGSGVVSVMAINPVQVTTPAGLRDGVSAEGGAEDDSPMPIPFNANGSQTPEPAAFQEMDEFLNELSWSELPAPSPSTNTNDPAVKREAAGGRASPIFGNMDSMKMKRKRPSHTRAQSNPVDLLHNLDQVRLMAQQTKQLQQQQQQDPTAMMFSNPALFNDPMAFNGGGQVNQFQVPAQIASGQARSLHGRQASLPTNPFGNFNPTGNNSNTSSLAFAPPPARSRRHQRSTGLSMDMSLLNFDFLSVPEEEFQQQLHQRRQQQQQSQNPFGFDAFQNHGVVSPPQSSESSPHQPSLVTDANRKLYKCGRCGQPKVGHVCTMPDQRNNWTQVDLEVTKGLKVMRINCHILPVKNKWIPQHEENLENQVM